MTFLSRFLFFAQLNASRCCRFQIIVNQVILMFWRFEYIFFKFMIILKNIFCLFIVFRRKIFMCSASSMGRWNVFVNFLKLDGLESSRRVDNLERLEVFSVWFMNFFELFFLLLPIKFFCISKKFLMLRIQFCLYSVHYLVWIGTKTAQFFIVPGLQIGDLARKLLLDASILFLHLSLKFLKPFILWWKLFKVFLLLRIYSQRYLWSTVLFS